MRVPAAALAALASVAATAPRPDDQAGARAYAECVACHALEPGRNTPAGPTLHGIVGRPVASLPGFNYSPALRSFARRNPIWTRALLDAYLADPDGLVPGTEMGFAGMRGEARRAALLAWLGARPRRH
jgi:cytochrome c